MIDARDYREKNTWRRWVWNRIVERLSVPVCDANVLYLAASADLDRKVAAAKGFDGRKLYAVDRDARVVAALRAAGHSVICGDALDVIQNFGRPLHAVHLDFCCGADRPLLHALTKALIVQFSRGAVFSVNFLRGRDASSNTDREGCAVAFQFAAPLRKHRGAFAAHCLWGAAFWWGFGYSEERFRSEVAPLIPWKNMRLALNSYRSTSRQTFDSAVFMGPFAGVEWDARQEDEAIAMCLNTDTRRALATYRAVQTTRTGRYQ